MSIFSPSAVSAKISAKRAFASAGLARPGPRRRQLVNHHAVVGRKAIGRRIIPEGGDFSGGIDGGQCPVCQPDDGGRVEKNQFLAQTARPVTISGLTARDVKVRILGDVAIIHARTRYTTADGEQQNGRYTDVWARRDGKWLAVSARVTR